MSTSRAEQRFHTAQAVSDRNADLRIRSEVYVGKGSRFPIQLEPIYHTRTLALFHSSVTNTLE